VTEDGYAVCNCDECEPIPLSADDIEVWEPHWLNLGSRIQAVWKLEPKSSRISLRRVWQVGAFGGDALQIVLVVQPDRQAFNEALAQLVARLKDRFIVLTPTSIHRDLESRELLARLNADIVDLESNIAVLPSGRFQARKTAAELFSRFLTGTPGTPEIVGRQYVLRKGARAWRLVFDGVEGEINDGRGIALVAYLLFNPPTDGIHGTELASLVFGQAIIQEASLGADGDSTRKLIQQQAREWMAVLSDPLASEIEKGEAKAELDNLAAALNVTRKDSEGSADKQVRAIRRAIERLITALRAATDRKRNPHLALRAFGEHLHNFLWVPSSRFSGNRRARNRAQVAGRFTYEPPAGVIWSE